MTLESARITRRRLLGAGAAIGGGLVLGFHLPLGGRRAEAAPPKDEPNAWLQIAPDETVTLRVAHSEMGQGVYTALPMLIAEELEVDWRKVRAEMAPADPIYNNRLFGAQGTGGSTSVRESYEPLRRIGAQAREMLREAAAQRWGVPAAECVAREGRVRHRGSGREVSYGSVAEAAAKLAPPAQVALKAPKHWTLLGKPTPRLDTPAKVDGSALYGIDVKLPGMLVGTVRASPVLGGRLKAVDDKPALAVAGVHSVVRLQDAVLVLANGYWPARKGADALSPEWEPGPLAGTSSAQMSQRFRAALGENGAIAHAAGDSAQALGGAARRIEAVYEVPYLAHATMEPMNATVRGDGKGAEAWVPTQSQTATQAMVAHVFGLEPEQVQVHTTFLGGGFGRRSETDFVRYAALGAKASGKPVKVVWSREEDIQHDFYRPAALVRFRGGLDAAGNPVALEAKLVLQSISARTAPGRVRNGIDHSAVEGLADIPYGVPNVRVEYVRVREGAPVGYWRSVGHSHNAFFIESFVDELAAAAGKDPVAFRRALLAGKPRHRAVLDTAADAAGWGKPAPEGRFRGVALHESFGSIAAQVAEISIDAEGKALRVHKVTCAIDCGRAINPSTVEAQIESGIVYGLTAALFGEITLEDGRVAQANFDSYPMLKLAQMPSVEVHVIESGAAIGGLGEPGTPPIAPAVASAVFAATGRRIRALPFAKSGIAGA
jgi:isoquinoline 1-oxidoreductase beta subunit